VKVGLRGRGDEVVVLAGVKLQSTRCRTKRPEADCEVTQAVRLVTLGQDPGVRRHDLAVVKLLLAHVIDDKLFGVHLIRSRPLIVEWADNVDLKVRLDSFIE